MLKTSILMVIVIAAGFATPAQSAPPPPSLDPSMATCQSGTSTDAIAACTSIIDDRASKDSARARAFGARAQALTAISFEDDRVNSQDWTDCTGPDPQPAIAACTRIIDNHTEYDGRRADALYTRSKLLMAQDRKVEAMADFKRALGTFSDHQPGSRERAAEDYSAALRLEPRNSVWLAARGQIYLSWNNIKSASTDFDDALAINSKEGLALLGRALLRDGKGDPFGALVDLKAIAALPVDSDEARWLKKTATELMSQIGAD